MNRLAKLLKLLRLLPHKLYRQGLYRGVAATVEHEGAFWGMRFDSIIDIGASRGMFALTAGRLWPNATIHCFEPLHEPQTQLHAIAGLTGAHVHAVAIGPREEMVTINVSRRDDSSSLLPIGPEQAEIFPGTDKAGEQSVRVYPLSPVLGPSDLGRRALLKIDVQGYELEALKGCEPLLGCFTAVYVECSWVELYEGQALAWNVADWLTQRGFTELGRYNETKRGGRLVQADVMFIRRDVPVL